MPDIRKTLLVSLVFFAGCAASQVASRYAVPPARAGSDQRWEYVCKEVFIESTTQSLPDELTRVANAYGSKGWQLSTVAYQPRSERSAVPCFERPVP